ncbi:MAG TPA: VWA domain-containing protein [Vicinamibacterales bacterium]|nr:VWA domain-containing protein [Vicinamibacterales bacterium]
MTSRRQPLVVAVVALSLCAATALTAQRETREKRILVTVTGKDDAPVKDLAVTDFKVREDGVSREVLRVQPAADPMSVVLLVDDSEIAELSINEIRQGVSAFIKQILAANPQNEITLMTIGDRPTVAVPASSSAASLNRAVERIFARKGSGAYVLQGITDAAKILTKKEAMRRLIVAFDIEDGTEFSNDSHESVTTALKNARSMLWTVVLQERHVNPTTPEARERAMVLTDVAVASGGGSKAVLTRMAIPQGLAWAATMLTSQLDLGYSHPESLIPASKLEVDVTRKDVRLFAPHWGS